MKTYKCTYWVRIKRECKVKAEDENAALDLVSEGYCGYEKDLYEDFDDGRDCSAIEVLP